MRFIEVKNCTHCPCHVKLSNLMRTGYCNITKTRADYYKENENGQLAMPANCPLKTDSISIILLET